MFVPAFGCRELIILVVIYISVWPDIDPPSDRGCPFVSGDCMNGFPFDVVVYP